MIKRILLVLFFLLLLSNYFLAQQTIPKDTLITLDRSGCYGSCPDYKLTISADGSVTLELRMNGKSVRTIKSSISQEKLKKLVNEFNEADYFSLKNKYINQEDDGCPEYWTDYPNANTSLTTNGKTKSISHYLGCRENQGKSAYPEILTKIENKIDAIVETKILIQKQWVK